MSEAGKVRETQNHEAIIGALLRLEMKVNKLRDLSTEIETGAPLPRSQEKEECPEISLSTFLSTTADRIDAIGIVIDEHVSALRKMLFG